MWYIAIPVGSFVALCFVVTHRSNKRRKYENKRIGEEGYIALLEESKPTPDQRLRQAYFDLKRGQANLEHDQKLMGYERREIEVGKQENHLTLQEISIAREKVLFEAEKQQAEVQKILNEIVYARRDLDLATREQNLFISERKFEFLQTAFQKYMQFEKSTLELTRKEFFLAQKDAMQQLQEHGLLLKGRELSLEAKQHGLTIREGLLELRTQRQDNDHRYNKQDLLLKKDRYRNEMQRKENDFHLKLGLLKNEQRALQVEKRASDLKEHWARIERWGREDVARIKEWKDELRDDVAKLIHKKKELEKRRWW